MKNHAVITPTLICVPAAVDPTMLRPLVPFIALALTAAAISGPTTTADGGAIQLQLHCESEVADVRSMEHEYLEHRCWGHLGIHTYYAGTDTTYVLKGGSGTAFSVEQQLSPPLEDPGAEAWPPQVFTPLPIETSLDGIQWDAVASAEYKFAGLQQGGTSMRQEMEFEFETEDEPEFRYLRIRQPLSSAQGLSGYIDYSEFVLDVRIAEVQPQPPLVEQSGVHLSCLFDTMEAVWAGHPCWYGGINRWDAPSFFHTYPLEHAVLDRVEGMALFAYWRPEDPGTCCGQTIPGMLDGPVFLQSSLDGVHWGDLATFNATYGVPLEFSVDLDGHETRFLRLVSDKHPGYWEHPALKRPEAYLLHSELVLDGWLPQG